MTLKGTFTAMITPFLDDTLDERGLVENIQTQLKAGITGLVFLGSTGEASTLTFEERERVIEIGVKEAKHKTLVIVGTGSNSTRETIERTKRAQELGADCALVVTPYYNKPTQEGLFRHYEALVRAVDLPILIYNNPGRTAVNVEPATLLRMAALPHIIGVKEASGNISQIGEIIRIMKGKYPQFTVLCGDDGLTLPMMSLGGMGLISIVSNLIPKQMISLVSAALNGEWEKALSLHEKYLPLFKQSFIETNPMPIKEAMHLCGFPAGGCRLPLCEMKRENREKLLEIVTDLNLR